MSDWGKSEVERGMKSEQELFNEGQTSEFVDGYKQGTLDSLRKSFLDERKRVDLLRAERDALQAEVAEVRGALKVESGALRSALEEVARLTAENKSMREALESVFDDETPSGRANAGTRVKDILQTKPRIDANYLIDELTKEVADSTRENSILRDDACRHLATIGRLRMENARLRKALGLPSRE
ncbi:MAG: hypothetical protein IPO08_20810 [Xanthomonadales bacterium]|nr:hypothetical protein [Xanthomonadales bacterium]